MKCESSFFFLVNCTPFDSISPNGLEKDVVLNDIKKIYIYIIIIFINLYLYLLYYLLRNIYIYISDKLMHLVH